MGILIDTNVVPEVFDKQNTNHNEFRPVLDALINPKNKSKLVFGGTKYLIEVNAFKKYLGLITELSRSGKTLSLEKTDVDRKQNEIESDLKRQGKDVENDDNYNDCHILAIAVLGRVKVIISNDKKSIPLIRTKAYYSHRSHVPVFYTGLRNKRLLQDARYYC